MKKLISLLALICTVSINAQTGNEKIITATLKDYNPDVGEFELIDESGSPLKNGNKLEHYNCCNQATNFKVEPADLLVNGYSINPKYKGKQGKFYCIKYPAGDGYGITKVEFTSGSTTQTKSAPAVDDYKTASCKIFKDGQMVGVIEGQDVFEIRREGGKRKGGTVQNTNEICKDGGCRKIVIDKDGFISEHAPANSKEGNIYGKIVGDKMYRCSPQKVIFKDRELTFKGDKQKAAIIAVAFEWFKYR